jgi:Cdc6-like AAA superfamily ATPase
LNLRKDANFSACGVAGIELHSRNAALCALKRKNVADPVVVAKNANGEVVFLPELANRHDCITGATGTGKTVTLQVLVQALK